jgi:Phage portal protein
MKITSRIKHAWNAFTNNESLTYDYGYSSSRPIHKSPSFITAASYVSAIYNRIAMDVSMTGFKHVKINPDNEDVADMKTGLNNCLTVESNIDQTHIQLIQDLVYSMFDEGVVAVVPVETTISPKVSAGYDINSLRVGKIVNWFPKHVKVKLYNELTGQNQDIMLEKKDVAIIENPLYAIVNDENSTLKRLIRKLSQLDDIDSIGPNRLDLLISVPYGIKTESQRKMAEKRIKDIEAQLAFGRNGIAYIDGTEKAQQLNRPLNSQLPETIDSLTQQFYNQLGLTANVFNGTASEVELRTYYTRTIDPIVENIVAEFNRKFLTKTARTQGQAIVYYRDMFKTVPVEIISNLGDSFRRNSIASSNELRKLIGLRPSNDPRADELFNPNIADKNQNTSNAPPPPEPTE